MPQQAKDPLDEIFDRVSTGSKAALSASAPSSPAATPQAAPQVSSDPLDEVFDRVSAGAVGAGPTAAAPSGADPGWRAAYERDLSPSELAWHNTKKLARNIGTGVGNVVTGTEQFFENLGQRLPWMALNNSPIEQARFGAETVAGAAGGLVEAAAGPASDIYTAAREGDTDALSKGTSRFITETIPAAATMGTARVPVTQIPKSIASGASRVSTAVRGLPDQVRTLTGRGPLPSGPPMRAQINDLATVSRLNAMELTEVQPLLRELSQQWGIDPNTITTAERGSKMDLVGDLQRGLTSEQWRMLSARLGKDPKRMAPLPVEMGNGIVELADRPFVEVIDGYGDLPTTQAQIQIQGALEDLARKTIDDSAKRTLEAVADKVRKEGGTARGLYGVKKWLNKEAAGLSRLTPGQVINADIRPIGAYSDAARMIREQLYPVLDQASDGKFNLREAGRIEGQAIGFRDGIYKSWHDTAVRHAGEANKGWLRRAFESVNPMTQSKTGMASAAIRGGMVETPLAEFNRLFKQGIGGTEGFKASSRPNATGYNPPANLVGEQLTMESQTPPDLFGIKAPSPAAKLPAGSQLVAVTQGPQGLQYHYKLPNGIVFTSPTELQAGASLPPPPK